MPTLQDSLAEAVFRGDEVSVPALIEALRATGSDPHAPFTDETYQGLNPLALAVSTGHLHIVHPKFPVRTQLFGRSSVLVKCPETAAAQGLCALARS